MSNLIRAENIDASLKIAAGYSQSANILMKYIGQTRRPEIVHSMVVLRALALEVYLRSLYAIDRDRPYEGHHVRQIFDALGDETRRKVTEYYDGTVSSSEFIRQARAKHQEIKGNVPMLNLEHVLQEWGDPLAEFAYFYEPQHKVAFLAFAEMEKAFLRRIRELVDSKAAISDSEQKSAA